MTYYRKLGVLVDVPEKGRAVAGLVPPLSENEAWELYTAFLKDLFSRISKLKKLSGTVFHSGENPGRVEKIIPSGYQLRPQRGEKMGERLKNAFEFMLEEEESCAVIIRADTPDIPLGAIKHAYLKLKHKDIVLGPSAGRSYYLIGLRRKIPALFDSISWEKDTVLEEAFKWIASQNLSLSLLQLWYHVDTAESLALLEAMIRAKRLEKSGRLIVTESVLTKYKENRSGS